MLFYCSYKTNINIINLLRQISSSLSARVEDQRSKQTLPWPLQEALETRLQITHVQSPSCLRVSTLLLYFLAFLCLFFASSYHIWAYFSVFCFFPRPLPVFFSVNVTVFLCFFSTSALIFPLKSVIHASFFVLSHHHPLHFPFYYCTLFLSIYFLLLPPSFTLFTFYLLLFHFFLLSYQR